jgi:hypothetical protein
MKNIFLFVSVVFSTYCSYSQISFQKGYKGQFSSFANSASLTFDKGYIIVGSDHEGTGNNWNVYLIKTDSIGNILWTKTYSTPEMDHGGFVQQTVDSGYIVVGYTISYNLSDTDIFLLKTNSSGDTLWSKRYIEPGIGNNYSFGVEQCQDGGYIFSGTGFLGGFLCKTDNSGNIIWTKSFEGANWLRPVQPHQTLDGGYVYTFSRDLPLGNTNIQLIKTDSSGNLSWSKMYDIGGSDRALAVIQTSDGGYIITGTSNLTLNANYITLIKTDSLGNVIWAKHFGGSYGDVSFDVVQTSDGGFITAGKTAFGSGSGDAYVVKCDSSGNLLWSKSYSPMANGYGYSIQQTLDYGFIIAGSGTPSGSVYFIKTDSLGNSGCNQYNVPTIENTPTIINLTPPTLISNVTFTVDSTSFAVGNGGTMTDFCTTGIAPNIDINPITIVPNPNSGNFIVSTGDTFINGKIEIFSVVGNAIYSDILNNNSSKSINLFNIPSGIYYIKISYRGNSYCKKLIIERV